MLHEIGKHSASLYFYKYGGRLLQRQLLMMVLATVQLVAEVVEETDIVIH